jgi:N-acetylgalactosamine-N,N'-diacetylbacillosaminyl-diphospho-undecaprenol 4-alpha-N-acetylgalactosaminyltransferase
MTLLESLANETPVISFDCPCGPSEIIENNINGILVENQKFDELSKALKLVENDNILSFLKKNCLKSIEKYKRNEILHQWENLLNLQ